MFSKLDNTLTVNCPKSLKHTFNIDYYLGSIDMKCLSVFNIIPFFKL